MLGHKSLRDTRLGTPRFLGALLASLDSEQEHVGVDNSPQPSEHRLGDTTRGRRAFVREEETHRVPPGRRHGGAEVIDDALLDATRSALEPLSHGLVGDADERGGRARLGARDPDQIEEAELTVAQDPVCPGNGVRRGAEPRAEG